MGGTFFSWLKQALKICPAVTAHPYGILKLRNDDLLSRMTSGD
jgi:hypothetical protein